MQHNNWQCTKCGNTTFDTDQFRAKSSAWAMFWISSPSKFNEMDGAIPAAAAVSWYTHQGFGRR